MPYHIDQIVIEKKMRLVTRDAVISIQGPRSRINPAPVHDERTCGSTMGPTWGISQGVTTEIERRKHGGEPDHIVRLPGILFEQTERNVGQTKRDHQRQPGRLDGRDGGGKPCRSGLARLSTRNF